MKSHETSFSLGLTVRECHDFVMNCRCSTCFINLAIRCIQSRISNVVNDCVIEQFWTLWYNSHLFANATVVYQQAVLAGGLSYFVSVEHTC